MSQDVPLVTPVSGAPRRLVLFGGLASAAALGIPWSSRVLSPAARAEDPDADTATSHESLRETWAELLIGSDIPAEDPRIAAALAGLDESSASTREGFSPTAPLWPDLPFGSDAASVSSALGRMRQLAMAWATPGAAFHGDASLAEDLVNALEVVSDTGYHSGRNPTGNWWFWEIGIPNHLTDICVLLRDVVPVELTGRLMDAIAHFAPDPGFRGRGTTLPETGANRVDKSLRCALRGALRESSADLDLARDALSDARGDGSRSVFAYVTSGDGWYEDGSFVQHGRLPYVGTYGAVALNGISQILALLAGSPWEVTDPQRSVVVDAVEKSFAPFIWRGVMMDTVRGRAVSRQRDSGASNALSAAHASILLSRSVTGAAREAMLGRALGWVSTTPKDVAESASVAQVARIIEAETAAPALILDEPGLQVFADQDRLVHRSEDWAFTVSTSSRRIGRYEWGNKENAKGWYQGDGASFLQLASDTQQTDVDYWPTVDSYRLPGTTVELSPRESGLSDGTGIPAAGSDWGGGSSVRGRYGAWGMDHHNHDGSLHGKLSWFLVPDAVIALGAGITGTSGAPVETTVENRALRSGHPLVLADARPVVPEIGDSVELDAPSWMHLEGVGGYVLLGDSSVRILRERRHGAWSEINQGADTGGDDQVHSVAYARMSILHGADPTDSRYAYALLPTASAQATKAFARTAHAASGVQVLANSPEIQSVAMRLRPGTLRLANSFAAASTEWIRTDAPASVSLAALPQSISVGISDPSRTAETVTVTLPGTSARSVTSADEAVTVVSLDPVTLEVATAGTRGHTHRVTLST